MVTSQAVIRRSDTDASMFAGLRLTGSETDWLTKLPDTPGFNITCFIQRWWRETKLSWMARLTLAALGPAEAGAAIKRYLEATPCPSLFFTPEALGFLDFVARVAERPHVAEIARFERALLIAREAARQSAGRQPVCDELPFCAELPSGRLTLHPAAALLEFDAPPEELLGALVEGRALPPASDRRFPVLISPGLPHLWRPATADEARMFIYCQTAPAIDEDGYIYLVDRRKDMIIQSDRDSER